MARTGFSVVFRQYRTKSVWRLCTPSACKFPVIFHKNAREYIQYSLRFLFHLTKNLTTHLSHNLCAVLPKKIFPQGAPRGNISIYSNISKSVSASQENLSVKTPLSLRDISPFRGDFFALLHNFNPHINCFV